MVVIFADMTFGDGEIKQELTEKELQAQMEKLAEEKSKAFGQSARAVMEKRPIDQSVIDRITENEDVRAAGMAGMEIATEVKDVQGGPHNPKVDK